MSQAAYSGAAPIRDTTESETQWRDVAVPQSRWKTFLRSITKGELLIVPITHRGEEKQDYAQRWGARDIASLVSSAIAIVVVIIFSIVTIWMNTNKESSTSLGDLRERVTKAEGRNELLQQKYDMMYDRLIATERDLKAARTLLGMDIADGTRTAPKEK